MYGVAPTTAPSGLSFRRLALIGKRQWWVVIGCVVLAAAGSGGYFKTRAVNYTASATVAVAPPAYAPGSGSVSAATGATTSALFAGSLSPLVELQARSVVDASHGHGSGAQQLTGTVSTDLTTVYVIVTATTASQASAAANAAAQAFKLQRIRDLNSQANLLNKPLQRLDDQINTLRKSTPGGSSATPGAGKTALNVVDGEYSLAYAEQQTYSTAAGTIAVATLSTPATAVVNGKSKKVVEVALAAGLLAGLGIALAREQFDDKIRSSAEFAEISRLDVLAEIPVSDLGSRAATIADKPFGETAEAVRELRTALRFLSVKRPIRTVLVTSAGAGEGKSFVAANLAAAWAMSGVRTILVSSDMRRPSLERLFKLDATGKGLSEAIVDAALSGHGRSMSGFSFLDDPDVEAHSGLDADDVEIGDVDVDDLLVPTGVEGLLLLPSGPSPPNPAELLGSPELGKLMVALRERAEVVVLDSPPVMAVTDPLVLTAQADGVLFVISENRTSRAAAQRSLRLLESGLAPVLGVVVNRSSRSQGVAHY